MKKQTHYKFIKPTVSLFGSLKLLRSKFPMHENLSDLRNILCKEFTDLIGTSTVLAVVSRNVESVSCACGLWLIFPTDLNNRAKKLDHFIFCFMKRSSFLKDETLEKNDHQESMILLVPNLLEKDDVELLFTLNKFLKFHFHNYFVRHSRREFILLKNFMICF